MKLALDSSPYFASLQMMDYRSIAGMRAPSGESTLETRYIGLRALVLTARYDEALESIQRLLQQGFKDPTFTLIRAQIDAFHQRALPESLEALSFLEFSDSTYLQAELEFARGYMLGQMSRFRKAIPHYTKASLLYRSAGLPLQAGVACFNLAVFANHLGLAALFEKQRIELESLVAETADPTLEAYVQRLRAYRAIDAQDYAQAMEQLEKAYANLVAVGRIREADSVVTFSAYCALKLQEFDRFEAFKASVSKPDGMVAARIDAFSRISALAFPTYEEVERILQEYESGGMDGVSLVMAADLLFDALGRARDHEAVLRFYRRVQGVPRVYEQAPDLVDFRASVIRAYFALGLRREGSHLLAQFELDARSRKSSHRLALAQEMRQIHLQETKAARTGAPGSLLLDLTRDVLISGEAELDLSRKPVLKQLLLALFERPEGIAYEELYEECYEHAFNPLMHSARFHSLIARAKKALGASDALLWAGQTLRLNPAWVTQVVKSKTALKSRERMRELSRLLHAYGGPVPVSRLSKVYSKARRTLQLDLEYLVHTRQVERIGRGRSTVYQLRTPA